MALWAFMVAKFWAFQQLPHIIRLVPPSGGEEVSADNLPLKLERRRGVTERGGTALRTSQHFSGLS